MKNFKIVEKPIEAKPQLIYVCNEEGCKAVVYNEYDANCHAGEHVYIKSKKRSFDVNDKEYDFIYLASQEDFNLLVFYQERHRRIYKKWIQAGWYSLTSYEDSYGDECLDISLATSADADYWRKQADQLNKAADEYELFMKEF